MSDPVLLNAALARSGVDAGLVALLDCVAQACVEIADAVERGALVGTLGVLDQSNVQGETQKQLDVITNDILVHALQRSSLACGLASEEEEHSVAIPGGAPYLVLFDPLDGSSNIDVNVTVGTIFSVLPAPNSAPEDADFLQPGHDQIAAGYVAYGPSTVLVLTTGDGVMQFTLDRARAAFVLTNAALSVPRETGEFAINAARERHWLAPIAGYVRDCVAGKTGPRGRDFNMRWIASMVADVHRIMTRGGVFLYPNDHAMIADGKTGKLRLMYEANPMGWLVEQAGGVASTGEGRILDVVPSSLHQRVPVVLGSAEEVAEIESRFDAT